MIEKLKNVIDKIKPSCIIDLSIITSNYFKPEHIFHMTSCVIHNDFKNYKYNSEFPNYIECTDIYKKTKYLIQDTITINNSNNSNNSNTKLNNLISWTTSNTPNTPNTSETNNASKILTGPESIYITFLLSNYFNIPCVTLGVTYDESRGSEKSTKSLNQASNKIINTMFSLF
jgi:hypothetical protein